MPHTFKLKRILNKQVLFLIFILFSACKKEKPQREVALFNQYCASCHLAPEINDLPKDVWKNGVLPKMADFMQIEEMYQDPNIVDSVFRPKIKLMDWVLLSEYIIANAPEEMNSIPKRVLQRQGQFKEVAHTLESKEGAYTTFMDFDDSLKTILLGNTLGEVNTYNPNQKETSNLFSGSSPVTWFSNKDTEHAISEVGILDPSERTKGIFSLLKGADTAFSIESLHRPVFHKILDLNKDGKQEVLISEFGNSAGKFSLFHQNDSLEYKRRVLLNLPGVVKAEIKDFDADGFDDIIVMSTQAYEGLTIFYQRENLKFEAVKVLEFSSVYGSSWFELVDFDGDGFDDIITVNGDNADYSYTHKPYHGLRIHLNDGSNQFEQRYFFPMYGATRVVADDFDNDGDIDFGIVSTFPDYENKPEQTFIYLKNLNSKQFQFQPEILHNPNSARWFLMDTGDIDSDGDIDIILSSFTYSFTPVPPHITELWDSSNTDLLILENKLE
ncbi:FG-GAP repeat domain-containing protein [Croceivirga thetidis]|uniref:VCBS repeat-containing protein n=1 Tax=Croceivirga thetidis TaxID=2721623 RepID=A0ABX1GRR3_9FLAO|nr:VCBS repeat-containing protein [Croceivirga thetidis]NKI32294.1 VCBS repeat-containing protein [Croceivirga thetidis]